MEVKPHVIVKTEKEFDDRETMRLAEEKAKKVVVKKQSRGRQGQWDKWRGKDGLRKKGRAQVLYNYKE